MNDQSESAILYTGKFILEHLRRFGSNLNRKHQISFWMYFPEEQLAHDAASRAKSTGLEVEVSPPIKEDKDCDWLCLLYYPHIPDEILLEQVSQFCVELTSQFSGKFDGWEASLELEEKDDIIRYLGNISSTDY
jgi:hypothetical protein